MFLIFRQRSSYPIVSVGFCKACLFVFKYSASSAALLHPHSYHLYPQDLKSSMFSFVLNLVIIYSLTIHPPPFFLLLTSITLCLSLHVSLSCFLCISELTSFCVS